MNKSNHSRDAMLVAGIRLLSILILVGGLLCGSLLLVNLRKIKMLFRRLNSEGKE